MESRHKISDLGNVMETDELLGSEALSTSDISVIDVEIDESDGGIENGAEILKALHAPETESRGILGRKTVNTSPTIAFEIRHDASTPTVRFASRDEAMLGSVATQLEMFLPNSEVSESEGSFLDLRPGRYVAACELDIGEYTLWPLKHTDIEGFQHDPLRQSMNQMSDALSEEKSSADVVVQTVLKPANQSWTQGVGGGASIGALADESEADGGPVNPWHPTNYHAGGRSVHDVTAEVLRDQYNSRGWKLNFRVVASSEDAEEALLRHKQVAEIYMRFYLASMGQGFEWSPLSGDELRKSVENAVQRNYVAGETPIVKSEREVAGLVHPPLGDEESPV